MATPKPYYPVSATIDPVTREILFDRHGSSIVEFDGNLLAIRFRMPRTFGQVDPVPKPFHPDNYSVEVNYSQVDPTISVDSDNHTTKIDLDHFFEVDGDANGYVHFTWIVPPLAATHDGWLWFSVSVFDSIRRWSTKAKKIRVWPAVPSGDPGEEGDTDPVPSGKYRYAVLYVSQELTDSQKKQARLNLGIEDEQGDGGSSVAENVDRMKFHNLLLDYPVSEFTNGITFSPTDDGGIKVSGTAAGDSFYNFYHNMSAIPSNLRIGKTYRAHYDGSSNIKFHFWFYKDGKYFSGYTISGDRDDLVIPDGINGMVIRLSVDSGVTVNEVVHPRIVSGLTNDIVLSRIAQYPPLTAGQKSDILSLISEYKSVKSRIDYDYDSTILSFLDSADTYTSDNKIRLCCDTFAELIWGGVSASTFPAESTSYTGNIVKAFDWGYFSPHMIRQRTVGLASRDSSGNIIEYYGFRTIGNTVNKSYSYNTRYTSGGALLNSQKWLGGLGANDLANELYLGGYEVPPSKADVGDLVFYAATPYASTSDEFPQFNSAFRQIFHVAIITARINGFFEVAEITSENNGASPLVVRSIFSENDFLCARSGFMQRYAVMFARHPAAFGMVGNVPEKFQNIPTRLE